VGDIVRFTADASHELRTPVALVRTTAEIALRHDRTPHEYRSALKDVLEHAGRMSGLVEDLLVLARTDAGIETPGDATVDLRDIAAATGQEMAALAGRRSVNLSVDLPPQALIVRGDEVSLRRLLLILLDNAVKYSPKGGDVRLRMSVPNVLDGASTALIEVSDNGIGLDPTEIPRLFERFYRGRRARQHAPDGSGLGLAIARTIVERYHWSMTLAAAGEADGGAGCRVAVRVPLDRTELLEDAHGPRAIRA
jgi:signal transduction histidine kinase